MKKSLEIKNKSIIFAPPKRTDMKTKKIKSDYVKAVKSADRANEIATHGKLISTRPTRVAKSKKVYDRKKVKKNLDLMK